MDIIDAVSDGFRIAGSLKKVWWFFYAYLFLTGLLLLAPFIEGGVPAIPKFGPLWVLLVFMMLVKLCVISFLQGGALGALRDHSTDGKADIGRFAGYGSKYFLRLFASNILYRALVLLPFALYLGILALSLIPSGVLPVRVPFNIAAIAFLLALAGVFASAVFFMYAMYIVVAEDEGIVASFRGSMLFVKKGLAKVLGLICVLGIVAGAILMGAGIVSGTGGAALGILFAGRAWIPFVFVIAVYAAGNAYLKVLVMATFMNFYLTLSGHAQAEVAGTEYRAVDIPAGPSIG